MGLSEKDEQHGEDRGGPKLRCHEHATCNRATMQHAAYNIRHATYNRSARFGRQHEHEHEYGRGTLHTAGQALRGAEEWQRRVIYRRYSQQRPDGCMVVAWLHGVCCMLRAGGRSIRSSSSRKRCATGCTRRTGGSRCRHVRVRPHALQKSQASRQSRRYHGVRACVRACMCSCALAFG